MKYDLKNLLQSEQIQSQSTSKLFMPCEDVTRGMPSSHEFVANEYVAFRVAALSCASGRFENSLWQLSHP